MSAGSKEETPSPAVAKACWLVVLPGRAPFFMVGEKSTKEQALAAARLIWPAAEVK